MLIGILVSVVEWCVVVMMIVLLLFFIMLVVGICVWVKVGVFLIKVLSVFVDSSVVLIFRFMVIIFFWVFLF